MGLVVDGVAGVAVGPVSPGMLGSTCVSPKMGAPALHPGLLPDPRSSSARVEAVADSSWRLVAAGGAEETVAKTAWAWCGCWFT